MPRRLVKQSVRVFSERIDEGGKHYSVHLVGGKEEEGDSLLSHVLSAS